MYILVLLKLQYTHLDTRDFIEMTSVDDFSFTGTILEQMIPSP